MDHNIFMKQIGSTVVILNHSEVFFEDIFLFPRLFGVFFISKILCLYFHNEKLFCNALKYTITFFYKTNKI